MQATASIRRQWERLHADASARARLDSPLQEGWARALAAGLDPLEARPPMMPKADFGRVYANHQKLVVFAGGILAPWHTQLKDQALGALLFSREGVLLQVFAQPGFRDALAADGIEQGTRWAEDQVGVNAFSRCIAENGPAALVGAGHYARFFVDRAFYGCPVQLPNQEVCGALVLAAPVAAQSGYLLPMAQSLAHGVGLQFFWFELAGRYTDAFAGQGMIDLDQSARQNRILVMSDEVCRMLDIPASDFFYRELETLIDPPPANAGFWQVVNGAGAVTDRTMQITCKGRQNMLSISTARFRDEGASVNRLLISVTALQRFERLAARYPALAARTRFEGMLGESGLFLEAVRRSRTAAGTDSSVLLLGESGVGKELMAQAMHNASRRRRGPFVALNCAAFARDLVASELFGYESGAFTGAKKGGSIGKFELANNGTLFLDEIADMPLDLQAMMLRVLEQRSFMKVGGNTLVQANVRIISATNVDLAEKIRNGLFREDLFYRLGVVRIQIPPLRERGGDVLLLARHFLPSICTRLGKPQAELAPDAEQMLQQFSWPGNVRQLQNVLEGVVGTRDDIRITAAGINGYLAGAGSGPDKGAIATHHVQRAQIVRALRECRGNRTKAAAKLGMSRRTFYRRLDQFGLTLSGREPV